MKFRISLVLLTLALAASSAVTAHAKDCTNLTIKRTYAFTIHGQILTSNGPLLVDGIARTTFDGNGNVTQVDAVAVNGNIALVWRPGTGTYSVNQDCTGTMTLVNQGQAPLHLAILVSQSGGLIHAVVTDPGFAITADADRVTAPRSVD
jgi:H+/gluconate symporter-like permease